MNEDMKKMIASGTTKIVLYALGAIAFTLLVFQTGVSVGYREATFSSHFGDNYHHLFENDRPQNGIRPLMDPQQGFVGGYGAAGTVVRVALPNITIADKNGVEKVVTIDEKTVIRKMRETITSSDIAPEEMAVVFGTPDDSGAIHATLIRLFPAGAPPIGDPAEIQK